MLKRYPILQHRRTWAIAGTIGILMVLILVMTWVMRAEVSRVSQAVLRTTGMDLAEEESSSVKYEAPPSGGFQSDASVNLLPRKLIRNAKLSLEIQKYETFDSALKTLTSRYGYLSNIQVRQDEHGVRRADITLRVDAARFEEALAAFKQLGKVRQEEISVEDVTRTYADLEARFANKRVSAARLREIIQNRTGKLSEVIEAEEALARVTEEMESMEAQKRSLDNQLSYSTIRAEVNEPAIDEGALRPSLWAPLGQALKDARSTLIGSLAFLLSALIVLSPWALLLSLGFILVRRFIRKKTREAVPESTS